MGLEVNKKLCKIYDVLRKPCNENECVRIGTSNFEIMENCTYLGTVLTHRNKLRREIEKRITVANTAYYALLSLRKSQSVLKALKIRIFKTLIRRIGNSFLDV